MSTKRKPYPSDVGDDGWQFALPYPTLMRLDAPQRDHDLREVFNALRWMARAGAGWRLLPHDFPPWEAVYQQTQRWLKAGVFESIAHDLRVSLRLAAGRAAEPTAAIFDARTLQSTVENGRGISNTCHASRAIRTLAGSLTGAVRCTTLASRGWEAIFVPGAGCAVTPLRDAVGPRDGRGECPMAGTAALRIGLISDREGDVAALAALAAMKQHAPDLLAIPGNNDRYLIDWDTPRWYHTL